jgi:deoxycytidylate deaminase
MKNGMKNKPFPVEWKGLSSASTHAEMNLILSTLRQMKKNVGRRKSHSSEYNYGKFPNTLVVISIYKNQLRNSRPCNECIRVMRMYKIKRVVYSTGNAEEPFHMETVLTMPFMCQSRGNRCVNH